VVLIFVTSLITPDATGDTLALGLDTKIVEIVKLSNITLKLNQLLDGKKVKELKGHKWSVKEIKANYSRNMLMTMSSDAIQLWNLTTFELVKSLFSKAAPFTGACFSADGQSLFTAFQVEIVLSSSTGDIGFIGVSLGFIHMRH
jgi:WD40 repeat protein